MKSIDPAHSRVFSYDDDAPVIPPYSSPHNNNGIVNFNSQQQFTLANDEQLQMNPMLIMNNRSSASGIPLMDDDDDGVGIGQRDAYFDDDQRLDENNQRSALNN